MSSATAIRYSVEELAAMQEAAQLAHQRSRLRLLEQTLAALAAECSVVAASYRERVAPPATLRVVGTETSERLRAIVDHAEREVQAARAKLNQVRSRQQRDRLRARLHAAAAPAAPGHADADVRSAATSQPTAPPATQTRPLAERVEACLGALDDGVELSEEFVTLAGLLTNAPQGRDGDAMALRVMQDEVARLNRGHRTRQAALAALDELDVRLGAAPQDDALRAREALEGARERVLSGQPSTLADLEVQVARVEEAARRDRDRLHVQRSLTTILAGLGYDVVEGFEKVVPEGGQLVRKAGWTHHGVRVQVDGDEIALDVVRTGSEQATAATTVRDEETETAFCADVPALIGALAQAGVAPLRVHRIPPGMITVPRVEAPAGAVPRPVATRTPARRNRAL